jgi:predicted metal-dependent hydrolase
MKYSRISIRNQRGRWGSCSSKKNLNFNYRILDLNEELQDYVIVHELCHLVELNHGENFWNLMEKIIPKAKSFHSIVRKKKN